ncbi:acetamidase/formamidase family protein [Edaphobacter acidisoli]|uniref:acetamidase/formamidase family protein n=1 Tax=Edaphobacter acidisoli TaxID=2040573 RepID=UPI00166BDB3B|nr:acetamidase/formamidase family protein [Edaphobacter acidisoli]
MRAKVLAGCVLVISALSAQAWAYQANDAARDLTGRWFITADWYGTPRYMNLDLAQNGDKLTGKFNGSALEGTVSGSAVHYVAKDGQGASQETQAVLENGALTGTMTWTAPGDTPVVVKFTAMIVPKRPTGPAQVHEFTPTVFYRQFSALNKPVLTVAPGDTIHTWTVDAGGTDAQGVRRVMGGNPETGPFYVESAMPGDTLVVHIKRLRLNRDWAVSDDDIVESATNSNLAVKVKDNGKSVRWHLDREKGVAYLETPGEHTAHYTVPLRPMLGCIAVAPPPAAAPPPTGDSGSFGGNMDFNGMVEGATLYLPVMNPGALLYFGDGHAMQGDGELNGNALETSMDVEITVDVIPGKRIGGPRVETADEIVAMGLEGSVDEALKSATSSMADWLSEDYKLTSAEVAEVLGTSAEYHVSEVADRNSGVVLKIKKERLQGLVAEAK